MNKKTMARLIAARDRVRKMLDESLAKQNEVQGRGLPSDRETWHFHCARASGLGDALEAICDEIIKEAGA